MVIFPETGRFVPKSFRTQNIRPKSFRTQVISYPSRFIPKSFRTQANYMKGN